MLALGGKTKLVTLPQVDGPLAYTVAITRLPALNGDPAGSYDNDSASPTYLTFLHLKVALPELGPDLVEDADALPFVYEWNPEGEEILPPKTCQLYLTGGSGRYGVKLQQVPIAGRHYTACERRLLRFLPGRAAVTTQVPSGHTGIGCVNATATILNLDDTLPMVLTSSWPSLIVSGTRISTDVGATPNLEIWTSFRR